MYFCRMEFSNVGRLMVVVLVVLAQPAFSREIGTSEIKRVIGQCLIHSKSGPKALLQDLGEQVYGIPFVDSARKAAPRYLAKRSFYRSNFCQCQYEHRYVDPSWRHNDIEAHISCPAVPLITVEGSPYSYCSEASGNLFVGTKVNGFGNFGALSRLRRQPLREMNASVPGVLTLGREWILELNQTSLQARKGKVADSKTTTVYEVYENGYDLQVTPSGSFLVTSLVRLSEGFNPEDDAYSIAQEEFDLPVGIDLPRLQYSGSVQGTNGEVLYSDVTVVPSSVSTARLIRHADQSSAPYTVNLRRYGQCLESNLR